MSGRHRGPRRAPIGDVWLAALALLVTATLSATLVTLARPVTIGGHAAAGAIAGTVTTPDNGRLATAAETAPPQPVRLRIDKIGLATDLVRLDLDQSGAIKAPDSPQVAGWFGGGPVPGDAGPAVLAGHVDSPAGPAVFFQLKALQLGDRVLVDRSDGKTVVFVVTAVRLFAADRFPAGDLREPTSAPELRLVTCGGPRGLVGGRPADNVIVEAVAAP